MSSVCVFTKWPFQTRLGIGANKACQWPNINTVITLLHLIQGQSNARPCPPYQSLINSYGKYERNTSSVRLVPQGRSHLISGGCTFSIIFSSYFHTQQKLLGFCWYMYKNGKKGLFPRENENTFASGVILLATP